jgi:hypothetical protein
VLANLPRAVKTKLQDMNFPVQKVVIPAKFKSKATNTVRKVKFNLVTASSAGSSQKFSKLQVNSQQYLTKKVKKVGSGRNPKYPENAKRVALSFSSAIRGVVILRFCFGRNWLIQNH